jgi:branched-chain amino acid transport system permease protein
VLVISALFPGVAGGVIAWNWSFIDPYQAFDLLLSFNTPIMAVFGGVGTVWGPVVGAVVMSVLIETLWVNLRNFQAVVFGLLVVVIVMAAPRGVAPLLSRALRRPQGARA